MSLHEESLKFLEERRNRVLKGGINSIPSPFVRFRNDFIGLEPSTYLLLTSFTKGAKTQFVCNLLFEAMMYCYTHPEKNVSIKVLYFALEETPQRILNRFYSWLLFKKHNIRISPSDLRSSNNEKPVSEEILEILKSDEFKEIVAYFEKCFEFPLGETNATGIYKYCKSYAENHGTVHKKAGKYKDELGVERETMVFSHYEPSNPNEYVFPVVDTINLIDTERGMTKKQTIDKLSEYCAKYLRNRYFQSPIVIQQQNAKK